MFPNEKLFAIKEYGCCIFTFMWCLGIEPKEDIEAIMLVSKMIDKGVIGKDCLVYWQKVATHLTGRNITVEFVDIKDKKQLKKIKDRTPVKFEYNGKGHWIGIENGKMAFNSLESSVCVDKGKPTTARIITFCIDK